MVPCEDPFVRKRVQERIREGMIRPYRKVLRKADASEAGGMSTFKYRLSPDERIRRRILKP
jgi:hypothetical protein